MLLRIAVVLALLGLAAACADDAGQDATSPTEATPTNSTAKLTEPTVPTVPTVPTAPTEPTPNAATEPPLSSTDLPTMTRPAAKPTGPSDRVGIRYLSGVVTRGGTGPCYGMRGDDGRQYALYNSEGMTLPEDARIRARVAPLMVRIYCGPGEHLALVAFGLEK